MISDSDRRIIQRLADKYHAERVLLFGSSLSCDKEGQDIDIGVEGVAPGDFFSFYGELLCSLSKPVDVVDLAAKSRFVEVIRREGVLLHA